VPEREKQLIEKRRAEAKALGVSPDLIEDVLKRIIRESYQAEGEVGYKCINQNLGPIVIIGGRGQMGRQFGQMFKSSGFEVRTLDVVDWIRADDILAGAGLVVVAVPIRETIKVIEKLPKLDKDCLLVDVTSKKTAQVEAMLKSHDGPVMGMHPMFGPSANLVKQVVVTCEGRNPKAFAWLMEQFELWGLHIKQTTPEKHDKAMELIQVFRHFTTAVTGFLMEHNKLDIDDLLSFSSPIYRLELAMIGRLFAQDPILYADIIYDNAGSLKLLKSFQDVYANSLRQLEEGNKQAFIQNFQDVTEWLGPRAEEFLKESDAMLKRANDHYVNDKK
jgi:chorismate mutase/prephenate dehydrogenase